jgi:radial spoke head protein 1
MRYSNGCHYVGFFLNEKRHGYGKCWYPNGCVYSGQWKEGRRHGVGEMSYANGDRYNGEWKEDKRHGAGVYHWKDGRADVCRFYEQEILGEGYRWSADRKFAWRLIDGEMAERDNLTFECWRMIAKSFLGCVPSHE